MLGMSVMKAPEAAGTARALAFNLSARLILHSQCLHSQCAFAASVGGKTTVDRQPDADDEARARAAEPQHGGSDFLCAAEAAD